MSEPLFHDEFLRQIELLYLVSKKVFAGNQQATRRARRLGAGIEVADFRPYAAGDDLRHIDWNYYGSSREMIVRLFEEEEDLHIYFLLDVSRSMRVGGSARMAWAKRLVAALGYIGLANLDRVSIVPFSDRIVDRLPASRGRGQIWKVFRFLEKELQGTGTDTRRAFRDFVAHTPRRGLAVIVSDFYDHRGVIDGINQLRFHRFEPLVFHVWDEDDLAPELEGDLEITDCETDEVVRLTVTPSLLSAYRSAHAELMDEVADFCRRKDVLYFRASVQTPLDDIVLRVFRAGGFLR